MHEHWLCSFSLPVSHPDSMDMAMPRAGQHERSDIPSVAEVLFQVCSYSEVQAFPFSIPPTVQSLFSLAGKAPTAAHK